LITLYITPVYYTYLDALQGFFRGRRALPAEELPIAASSRPVEPEAVNR